MTKNYFLKNITAFLFVLLACSAMAQSYCMLPGRTPYAYVQPGIRQFKLNKIVRNSANVESFGSVVVTTNMMDSLVTETVYTVTINHNEDSIYFPGGTNNICVFIDYNADFDYTDPGETVISKKLVQPGVFTGTFMVPAGAQPGVTGMRVTAKMSEDVGHTAITPCDSPADPTGYHGEIEDYWVDVYKKPVNTTGLNESHSPISNTTIYPNPAHNVLNLAFTAKAGTEVSVDLLDLTGRKVAGFADKRAVNAGRNDLQLTMNEFDKGIYFVRLQSGSSVYHHKIVVE